MCEISRFADPTVTGVRFDISQRNPEYDPSGKRDNRSRNLNGSVESRKIEQAMLTCMAIAKGHTMQRTATPKLAPLRLLLELLLSLNLALVVFYYVLVRHFVDAAYSMGTSDAYAFLYYFFRAAVRLNRILHYQPSGYEKYIRYPNAGGRLGVELAFALTTVFLCVLFLSVLRFV